MMLVWWPPDAQVVVQWLIESELMDDGPLMASIRRLMKVNDGPWVYRNG